MRESAAKINDNTHFYHQRKVFLETILKKTSHKKLAEILLKHLSFSEHELEKVTPDSFSELIDEGWNLLQRFSRGTHKLHIFDQNTANHEHTALVILNKNMPFLVDSVTNLLRTEGYIIDILIHPVIDAKRTQEEELVKLSAANPNEDSQQRESLIIVQLEEKLNRSDKNYLKKRLSHVLSDNFYAVHDWQTIRTEISHIISALKTPPYHFPEEENKEIQDFFHWLDEGHFTFLGFREYSFSDTHKVNVVKSLGISRNIKSCLYRLDCVIGNVEDFLHSKQNFTITKTIARATVHRNTPMDVIRLKKFNPQGQMVGEYEFIGLFTSAVYNESIKHFPILRRKVTNVIRASGLSSNWHDGKTLLHILETFPREELFQIEEKDLIKACAHVLELQERQKVTVLLREDPLGHLITCLIYVPKERYNAALRNRMGYILETEMNAQITSQAPTLDPDLPYARVYYTLAKDYTQKTSYHRPTLQRLLTATSLTWKDHFYTHLLQRYPADSIPPLKRKFLHAFPVYYQEQFTPEMAVHDIGFVQEVLRTHKLLVRIYEKKHIDYTSYNLRLFHPTTPVPLSDILPILESMGLKVITELNYRITEQETKGVVCLHDFTVELNTPFEGDFATRKEKFEEGLVQIWNGRVENDGFNALILAAALSWEHIIILRAYCKYLKQTEFTFTQLFIEQCMIRNASLAQKFIDLFFLLFAPDKQSVPDITINNFLAEIEQEIEQVEKSEDDRVLTRFLTLISATLRTNYFQRTPAGELKDYLIFKFNCHLIPNLPRPYPALEFFVYAPDFEAVHLRTGTVARGGLRWSDRQEDFRKEILGLMKAQKVKNTVIVPVGAKGGFVLKGDLSHLTHSERQSAGIKAYETFIQSMLDLTDNRIKNKTVYPKKVRRYDGKDSYLVVAADKGTATFSDIANKISEKNHYWLQDAFASGGSQGYDHKKIGITARGAWVCVMRHFREMNIDIQTTPFTVTGIGDMSGDVFGNGMLLSQQIKLIGAFNHLHIFLDPNPDPLISYKERQRLFEMPHSTWANYNPKLISKGGGVYKRTDKKIKISSEAKSALKLQRRELTPDELIQAILTAPVQLLWFGGIGTYIKSSLESNQEVGDRTNDHLRVDAPMLRCKVIGEGANLGLTQKGRIEYALAGGRINTDAIDNSGGVDCSDHEVNIKILLDNVVAHNKLSYKNRNKLLFDMTDNVARLVLRNNYLQSLAISMVQARGYRLLERQNRLIKHLEKAGLLDPQLADLPNDEEIKERLHNHQGLTRPEIAVLLAYGKIFTYEKILETTLPDDPTLEHILISYFPDLIQEKYLSNIKEHPLRREIITTYAANDLINRQGPSFLDEMMTHTGCDAGKILQAYFIARDTLEINDIWAQIEALDIPVDAQIQLELLLIIVDLVETSTLWLLLHGDMKEGTGKYIANYRAQFSKYIACLPMFIFGSNKKLIRKRKERLLRKHVPEDIAIKVVMTPLMQRGWDVIKIATTHGQTIEVVGSLYFLIGQRFYIDWLHNKAEGILTDNQWRRRTIQNLLHHLNTIQRQLTSDILSEVLGAHPAAKYLATWTQNHALALTEYDKIMGEITSSAALEVDMLSVAVQELTRLTAL